jgi:hypothetical protein
MTGRSSTAPAIGMLAALAALRAGAPTHTWTITGGYLEAVGAGIRAKPLPGGQWRLTVGGLTAGVPGVVTFEGSTHSLASMMARCATHRTAKLAFKEEAARQLALEEAARRTTTVDTLRARFRPAPAPT